MRYTRPPPAGSRPSQSGRNRAAVSAGPPRYPLASGAPATTSSPGTPAGTRRPSGSTTATEQLCMGRPNGIRDAPSAGLASSCSTVIVVSVGP